MTFDEIFSKAAKFGINKNQIGIALYGPEKKRQVYKLGKLTQREQQNLEKLNRVVESLITKRKKK